VTFRRLSFKAKWIVCRLRVRAKRTVFSFKSIVPATSCWKDRHAGGSLYILKNLQFGDNDGKNEAKFLTGFEKYFYDHDEIYEKALDAKSLIILGRKGTGKSLLSEYIAKKASPVSTWECKIISLKNINLGELIPPEEQDAMGERTGSFWRWIILLEFSRIIIRDNSIRHSSTKQRLEEFVNEIYEKNLTLNQLIEKTKTTKFSAKVWKFRGEIDTAEKSIQQSFLTLLPSLEKAVIELLGSTKNQYTVIFDEADDSFVDSDPYKKSIISLIRAALDLSDKIFVKNSKAKILLMIRSDIFALFFGADINKIRQDRCIQLDWKDTAELDSPIVDLVVTKIKASIPALGARTREELINLFFPDQVKGHHAFRYILERTFFRPRDVIKFLKLAVESFGKLQNFDEVVLTSVERDYSEYFYQEARDEMSGHFTEAQVNYAFALLQKIGKATFNEADAKVANTDLGKMKIEDEGVEEILKGLYWFGIISNMKFFGNRTFFSSNRREANPFFNIKQDMVVHWGLRKKFQLQW
jgi:hypothetical protein